MGKRKSRKCVKYQNSSSELLELNVTGNAGTSAMPVDLTVELCDSDSSENLKPKAPRRKPILLEIPENGFILGEISFMIQYADAINVTDDVQISLLIRDINDSKEERELKLELKVAQNCKHYATITTLTNFPWASLNKLLSRNYLWILKDVAGFHRNVIDISIAVLPEKTPLLKAKHVVELFTGKMYPSYVTEITKVVGCTEAFFKDVQAYQKEHLQLPNQSIQHVELKPTLCPYQARAVKWMLMRESAELKSQNFEWIDTIIEKCNSGNGATFFYNRYSQHLFLHMVDVPSLPRGGILADEMGLGKTVAVIALVLNNPRSEFPEKNDEELLSPTLSEEGLIRLIQPKIQGSESHDPDFDIRARNKESYMNSHEKLVYSAVSKGKALRETLNDWYNSQLEEFKASPAKMRKIETSSIKCICGIETPKKKQKCVECPSCKRLQHIDCVGFKTGYQYFCPLCWTKQKLVKSNATLIISPPSIFHQWREEIQKHVNPDAFPNGIFMYDNLKNNFIQPSVLASHDIVISTYVRLKAEVNRAIPNESSRKLRNEERFLRQCSPLAQIQWWRLCLDEAQMVEADGSQINQMAKLMNAVNRWSVTGTPIQKSVNDLFHLIDFLRVKPFTDKEVWNNLLYLPYINGNKIPLYSTIGQIFWRNSKDDVSNELDIPDQKVICHFLKFTAVEQNFYMREHTTSSMEFLEGLRRFRLDPTQTIDSFDKILLNKILNPLLNLRQACSHPLAVKGNKITTKTGSMTLTELFQYLYNKTKVECEEELRKHIAGLNGLAGIFCIAEDWSSAVQYYRKVLQVSEEYKDKVNVDSLQRIHTLTNLSEVLRFNGSGIPPTLRDEFLLENAKLLEDKYMQKAIGDLKSEQKLMEELGLKIRELENKFETRADVWWVRLIHTLTLDNAIGELMDKVSAELLESTVEAKKTIDVFLSKISSPRGLEVMLRNWLTTVKQNRSDALEHLISLSESSCDDLVNQAIDCHLRSAKGMSKKKCELCVCEDVLLDYECSLFAVTRKILKKEHEKVLDGAITKGSWKAHNGERVLKAILTIGKSKVRSEKWILNDGRIHLSQLDAMKKEFKQLRVVWMSLNHQIQARDEVNMCKVRLRLRLPGEPLPPKHSKLDLKEENKVETIHIIEHHEVEGRRLQLIAEAECAESGFKKKYGTLLYLGNLGKKENASPEPCPICKCTIENEWCVLQCGHSYCIDCIRTLLMRNSKPSINCPVCREMTKSSDLSFVDLSGREENCDIKVVGEHSTKIEAIVRTLLELRMKDENVKVLIFSTWAIVLKVLVIALQQNGISFRQMPGYNYQSQLQEFKDPKSKVTALLLPLSWGSKGLNLIEATHVFLVEPIMNPAEELQALGRVHRIGQTKETFVHRFLIRGTIEEKIYSAVSEAKDKWDKRKVTLNDLKYLFDIKNNFV